MLLFSSSASAAISLLLWPKVAAMDDASTNDAPTDFAPGSRYRGFATWLSLLYPCQPYPLLNLRFKTAARSPGWLLVIFFAISGPFP